MPKRKVQWIQGGYYHIYNRGAGRQPIFQHEDNYLYLLGLMKKVSREIEATFVAYCLLPNHYHWLVRQDSQMPAQRLPSRVFGSYTQAYNRQNQRKGGLFEGPYKAVYVDEDSYLRQLCRYIHLNPVRHGLVADVGNWPYSNYLECVGERRGTLVDREFVDGFLGSPVEYSAFVKSGMTVQVQLPEGAVYDDNRR